MRRRSSFAYLVVLLEWVSRYVLGMELASSLETLPCLRVLAAGLAEAGCAAEIVNSNQGCQLTSTEWFGTVQAASEAGWVELWVVASNRAPWLGDLSVQGGVVTVRGQVQPNRAVVLGGAEAVAGGSWSGLAR